MRLYKKAAVCLLAAAMAVSMMTACGPTGGSTGGNNNNPGTSQGGGENNPGGGEENPGTGEDKPGEGTDDDKKDDVIPADPTKVTWETSLTKKAFAGISKENFRFGGAYNGGAFAYATQGKKMLMIDQEEDEDGNPLLLASYTPDGSSLYLAVLDKPSGDQQVDVSKITGWMTAEEFGKVNNGSAEKIAAEKAETLAEMKAIKEMVYFVGGVKSAAFKAEATTIGFQTQTGLVSAKGYMETMSNVAVGNTTYTYQTVFLAEDAAGRKAGDLIAVSQMSGAQIVLGSKITACDSNTFPIINNK